MGWQTKTRTFGSRSPPLEEDQLDVPRLGLDDPVHLAARVADHDGAAAAADAADGITGEHLQHELASVLRNLMAVEIRDQPVGVDERFRESRNYRESRVVGHGCSKASEPSGQRGRGNEERLEPMQKQQVR